VPLYLTVVTQIPDQILAGGLHPARGLHRRGGPFLEDQPHADTLAQFRAMNAALARVATTG
jgi:hypothetical protein